MNCSCCYDSTNDPLEVFADAKQVFTKGGSVHKLEKFLFFLKIKGEAKIPPWSPKIRVNIYRGKADCPLLINKNITFSDK